MKIVCGYGDDCQIKLALSQHRFQTFNVYDFQMKITFAFNGGFPLLQIFYMRTRVKFTPVNKTEAMYGRWS